MEEKYIVYQLKTIGGLIKRKIERSQCKKDHPKLSMIQIQIIHFLFKNKDKCMHQTDIEKNFNIRRSTVSGILFNMEKNGIITRIKEGNKKRIVLTDKTIKKNKELKKEMEKFDSVLKNGIEQEKLDIFFEVIEKIKLNLKEEENDKSI